MAPRPRHRHDRAIELAAAALFAGLVGYCGWALAPLVGLAPWLSATLSGSAGLVLGSGVLALVPATAEARSLDHLVPVSVEWSEPVPELLLDQPLREHDVAELAELLLEDPLPAPKADSRVVQLFAASRMPSPDELRRRIDRHLGFVETPEAEADDGDALRDALDALRRSLATR